MCLNLRELFRSRVHHSKVIKFKFHWIWTSFNLSNYEISKNKQFFNGGLMKTSKECLEIEGEGRRELREKETAFVGGPKGTKPKELGKYGFLRDAILRVYKP